jgi:hypothetical protein
MNKIVGVTLAGVALYVLVRLLKMQSVSDLASLTFVNPRVHNFSRAGMSLRTEVAVNNAFRDSLKVTKAVVVLTSNGRFLTQSIAEKKGIEIRPLTITVNSGDVDPLFWSCCPPWRKGSMEKSFWCFKNRWFSLFW